MRPLTTLSPTKRRKEICDFQSSLWSWHISRNICFIYFPVPTKTKLLTLLAYHPPPPKVNGRILPPKFVIPPSRCLEHRKIVFYVGVISSIISFHNVWVLTRPDQLMPSQDNTTKCCPYIDYYQRSKVKNTQSTGGLQDIN